MIYSPRVPQYGLRENCSTQHALIDIVDKIQVNFNKKKFCSCRIFISLEKAMIFPTSAQRGNFTICTNYRGINLTQIAAKVYNRMILNKIRPVINSLLRPTQNAFRPARSTSSHVLGLRIIAEEVRHHKKVTLIISIDSKKAYAFDSVERKKSCLKFASHACGILLEICNVIRVMYENSSALVMTPEGNADVFPIDSGVY